VDGFQSIMRLVCAPKLLFLQVLINPNVRGRLMHGIVEGHVAEADVPPTDVEGGAVEAATEGMDVGFVFLVWVDAGMDEAADDGEGACED